MLYVLLDYTIEHSVDTINERPLQESLHFLSSFSPTCVSHSKSAIRQKLHPSLSNSSPNCLLTFCNKIFCNLCMTKFHSILGLPSSVKCTKRTGPGYLSGPCSLCTPFVWPAVFSCQRYPTKNCSWHRFLPQGNTASRRQLNGSVIFHEPSDGHGGWSLPPGRIQAEGRHIVHMDSFESTVLSAEHIPVNASIKSL